MEPEIETPECEETEAGSMYGSDSEMEQEGGSDEKVKARFFWEEIMVRDQQRRDTDRNQNDFLCSMCDDFGQMIHFQKSLLKEAGHLLVAILMDPPGSKQGRLRSSQREAQRIAKTLRCTFANYDHVASSLLTPDSVASSLGSPGDIASSFGSPDVIDDEVVFGVLVHTAASQLSLGHSVVVRAPLHRARIDLLLDAANSMQAKLVVLELQVNMEVLSEYNVNDVPKLVLPEREYFVNEDQCHLAFIRMATAMNHWHIGEGTESMVEDRRCKNEIKLQHFGHRHPLTLIEQKASTESSLPANYFCDCCMENIMEPDQQYYLCDHCDFSLHKSCAELPQCWDAPFHVHPLRLMILEHESDWVPFLGRNSTEPRISCIVCKQGTKKGPVYRCWSCNAFFIHHQCSVPLMEEVRHECHAHALRAHTGPEVQKFNCYGCGGQGQSICYSCSECPSDFHLECARKLTLTPSVKHSRHWHPLVLTSMPPDDGTDEYYCEVCAKRRHGDHWIYYCEPCEYEAHPHCVNPDIPPYTMPEPKESRREPEYYSDADAYSDTSPEEKEDEEEASDEEGSSRSDSDAESP